jgi:predicted alpha-1,2-mannosidase
MHLHFTHPENRPGQRLALKQGKLRFARLVFACAALGASPWRLAAAPSSPVDEVNVFIGTGAHGHTYPGATTPFGMVQLSPDTPMKGWDGCSGYHYSDSKILGFSHTHLSGTGIGDLGDVSIMPVTDPLQEDGNYRALAAERLASEFSHENEIASPGYYRVWLDKYKVGAELTATTHAGMHRYTFSTAGTGQLVIDLVRGINNSVTDATLTIDGNWITGHRSTTGWAKKRTIYFAMEVSHPFEGFGVEVNGKPLEAGVSNAAGKQIRAHLKFPISPAKQVYVRVGISPTSVEQARKNVLAEMPSWDFEAVHAAAISAWSNQLSRIEIASANPATRQTFYTALYHTMMAPTLFNNVDGSYRGADGQVHTNGGFQNYTTFSLWDTFRAEHPLLTITQPERVNDFIQSFLAFYKESPDHALPVWPLHGFETWCMIGYHSVPVILDAYAKGFRGFDAGLALKAMVDSATNSRHHQGEYQKLGYVASETGRRKHAAARTLEYAYDDWCIAEMAKALGKPAEAEQFTRRAKNHTNVFDPKAGFFRGKTASGTWREPYDPKAVNFEDYVEANAWQYTFAAMHDTAGMIELYGGKEAFIRKLDELFDQDSDIHRHLVDVTGLVGHYAHGNEPCHHVAYLYALAGAQHKTARRVRQILAMHYDHTTHGICGNDDCGQMSAWYVWSAIGLYPVNPANGVYVIGSPLVDKATIRLDPKYYKGGTFTIVARNVSSQNIYVQSATLNGRPLNPAWITHEQLANGGTLELEMGILPNLNWGKAE